MFISRLIPEKFMYKFRKTLIGRIIRAPYAQLEIWYRHYRIVFGEKLGIPVPNSFVMKNEWLKTFERNPLIVSCSDKVLAKDYVRSKIGGEYIIPTIAVYGSADEIDFDKLPNKFVAKTNNSSGTNIICTDKSHADLASIRLKLDVWMKTRLNYGKRHYIWFYSKIVPKILIEEFIESDTDDGLRDYKFWCFNGKPTYVWVDIDRYGKNKSRSIRNIDWSELPMSLSTPRYLGDLKKPENYDLMVELARKLSADFKLVRVDLYNVKGKIYFGELTFASGDLIFNPPVYDRIWGEGVKID